jgi:hypothetical protein
MHNTTRRTIHDPVATQEALEVGADGRSRVGGRRILNVRPAADSGGLSPPARQQWSATRVYSTHRLQVLDRRVHSVSPRSRVGLAANA